MKALFIGGTGTISLSISRLLIQNGWELHLLNRGNRADTLPEGVKHLQADINDVDAVAALIANESYDVVADFIAFKPAQVERDFKLFEGKTKQYIFISSASAYQKPLAHYEITESTPLANKYWMYSRNKIACEETLAKLYREQGFPITIVRPSQTYDARSIPLGVHGHKGSWSVVKRMLEGKPVIIHGDGTSLWTITHSTDFAKGFAGLMGNLHAIGETVQITSDESVTWNQIYATVADTLGVALNAVHVSSDFLSACGEQYDFTGGLLGDKANTVVFDNTKLKRLVPGFTATVRADEGIAQAVRNILENLQLQTEDEEFDRWSDRVIEVQQAALKEFLG
ncbi:MAG: SDR family oxidoreductase [Acetanaerobacterium sp.]